MTTQGQDATHKIGDSNPSLKLENYLNIATQDLGLKTLYRPSDSESITLDIVAVHGVGVHPRNTWVNRMTGVNWLKDNEMLPSVVPEARIMTFGYDSCWFGENAVKESLHGAAIKLLDELARERESCTHRPIIFIGHCFGGLVIQEAYTRACLLLEDWPDLLKCTAGIIFLGTPHQGVTKDSHITTQGQIYASIVSMNLQIQDEILQAMVPENQMLSSIVHNFTRKINNIKPSPDLVCYYEQRATQVGKIVGITTPPEFVVNESSGTLSGHRKQGFALDHFHMNKFENPEDSHYKTVSYRIRTIAQKIVKPLEARDIRNTPPIDLESKCASPGELLIGPSPTKRRLSAAQEVLKRDTRWKRRATVQAAVEVAAICLTYSEYDNNACWWSQDSIDLDPMDDQSSITSYDYAVKIYWRVLTWCEKTHDRGSDQTARSQYNLAIALDTQGKHEEAERLYRSACSFFDSHRRGETLSRSAKVIHLRILADLASNYCSQRRYSQAEDTFEIALRRQKKTLGSSHPETLTTRRSMAILFQEQGRLRLAMKELENVFVIQSEVLGRTNQETLRTLCAICFNYGLQGKRDEANDIHGALLHAQEALLGPDHSDTFETRTMLENLREQASR